MTFNFKFHLILLILFQQSIFGFNVYISEDSTFMSVITSEISVNNSFYFYINGSNCFISDNLTLNSDNIVVINPTLPSNNCSKLINNSRTVNNNITLNFLVSFTPALDYNIYLIMNNSTINQTFRTPDTSSSGVRNVSINSTFGINNLKLEFFPPSSPNGFINVYVIWLIDIKRQCVILWRMNCVNCPSKFTGSRNTSFYNMTCLTFTNSSFNVNETPQLLSNDSTIKPYTNYTVNIVPLNGYGGGELVSINFSTSPYASSVVENLSMTSNYSIYPISLTWSPPLINNGLIFQYIIWVVENVNSGKCVFWSKISSFDYINMTDGVNNIQDLKTCPSMTEGGNFIANQSSISLNITSAVIKPRTNYTIHVVAINGYGWGNVSSVVNQTVPYIPFVLNFTCANISLSEFNCSWEKPTVTNSLPVSYYVECRSSSSIFNDNLIFKEFTNNSWISVSRYVIPDISYTCTNKPCYLDDCSNKILTSIFIVPFGGPCIINMEEAKSRMLTFSNVKSSSQIQIVLPYSYVNDSFGPIRNFTLVVVHNRGSISNSSIDSLEKTYSDCDRGYLCPYSINLSFPISSSRRKRDLSNWPRKWNDQSFTLGDNSQCPSGLCNGPLSSNTAYRIGLRICISSGCGVVEVIMNTTYDFTMITAIVSVLVLLILIICSIFLFFYFRKRQRENSEITSLLSFEELVSANINDFQQYYLFITKDSYERASVQFSEINHRWKELENKRLLNYVTGHDEKNRYQNIRPYEHNVVSLENHNDYINASKICFLHLYNDINDKCSCSNIYLATQGPLQTKNVEKVSTIGDFWMMVHQFNVHIIVNLTKCIETFKDKCSQYWPSEIQQKEAYRSGSYSIFVTLQKVVINQVFEERTFVVELNDQEICVTQLHMISWPDHGCPLVNDFLEFYERFCTLRKISDSVIVHCSAGVGRTGTFILIDIELRKIDLNSTKVEIYNTLFHLRKSRCFMVQTEKQYVFAHEIIYEYLKKKGISFVKGKSHQKAFALGVHSYSNPSFQ